MRHVVAREFAREQMSEEAGARRSRNLGSRARLPSVFTPAPLRCAHAFSGRPWVFAKPLSAGSLDPRLSSIAPNGAEFHCFALTGQSSFVLTEQICRSGNEFLAIALPTPLP